MSKQDGMGKKGRERGQGKGKGEEKSTCKGSTILYLNPYVFSLQILCFLIKLQHQDDGALFIKFWCKFLGFESKFDLHVHFTQQNVEVLKDGDQC